MLIIFINQLTLAQPTKLLKAFSITHILNDVFTFS